MIKKIFLIVLVGILFYSSKLAYAADEYTEAYLFAKEYENELLARYGELSMEEETMQEYAQAIALDFIYSITLKRELNAPSGETDDIESMHQSHLTVAYAKFEQIQPYLKLGVTQLEEKMDNTLVAGLGRRNIKFDYNLALSYGGGLKGAYQFPMDYFVGYDLQYLRSNHELDKVTHSGETASAKKGEILLQQWHTAFFFGKKFDLGEIKEISVNVSPYLGVRYSDLELEIKKEVEYTVSEGIIGVTGKNKAAHNFGAFLGALVNLENNWSIGLEGRFLDETGFSVSGSYKF